MKKIFKALAILLVATLIFTNVGPVAAEAAKKPKKVFPDDPKIVFEDGSEIPKTIAIELPSNQQYIIKLEGVNVEVNWSSSKKKIAKVEASYDDDNFANLWFLNTGTVTITAKVGKKSYQTTINIIKKADELPLVYDSFIIEKGKSLQIEKKSGILPIELYMSDDIVINVLPDDTNIVSKSKKSKVRGEKYGTTNVTLYATKEQKKTPVGSGVVTVYVAKAAKLNAGKIDNYFTYKLNDESVKPLVAAPKINNIQLDKECIIPELKKIKENRFAFNASGPSVTCTVREAIEYQWYKDNKKIKGATGPEYTPEVSEAGTHKYKCKVTIPTLFLSNGTAFVGKSDYTNDVTIEVGGKTKISFNTNGGYWNDSQLINYSEEIDKGGTLSSLPSELSRPRSGNIVYELAGWATRPDATIPDVTTSTKFTDDLYTVYAVWNEEVRERVKVSFDTNGGYWNDPNIKEYSEEIDKGEALSRLPSGLGHSDSGNTVYEFRGWATSQSATTPDVTTSTVFNEDTTVYAVWDEIVEYTYTYSVPNAGTPVISGEDDNCIFCPSDNRRLFVEASSPDGGTLTYQWFKNGSAIVGATSYEYTPEPDYTTLRKDTYYCRVTNSKPGCSSTSVNGPKRYVTFVDTALPLIVHYKTGTVNTQAVTASAITHGASAYSADLKTVEVQRNFDNSIWDNVEHVNNLFDVPSSTYIWTPNPNEEGGVTTVSGFDNFTTDLVAQYASMMTKQAVKNKAAWYGDYPLDSEHYNDLCYLIELYIIEQ